MAWAAARGFRLHWGEGGVPYCLQSVNGNTNSSTSVTGLAVNVKTIGWQTGVTIRGSGVQAGTTITAGVGSNDTRHAVELTERATVARGDPVEQFPPRSELTRLRERLRRTGEPQAEAAEGRCQDEPHDGNSS